MRAVRHLARPVLIASLVAVVACQTVPITNRSQLLLIPEGTELQMGLSSYQEILGKSRVSNDPALNAQVARVGRRIATATGRTDYQWEFRVLDDKQVNAFCLPGGKVAVYTGLLPVARDDAGLAAVLGHEVAHAIARHGGERLSQQIAVQGGLFATQAALARGDARMSQLVAAGLGAGATVGLLLPWSRRQESEADHLGLIYMARAGYHPQAARDLWVRMGQASQGATRPPEFLSTHPAPETRIAQIEEWIPEALRFYQPAR
jgi:metalloendopeptidase OMA1, mitochondrial